MIVLDASAVLEWVLRSPVGERVASRMFLNRHETLHAPHLLYLEVVQVLRRFAAHGAISTSRGEEAVADLVDLRVIRHPHHPYLHRIWQLRENLTAHDAAYVSLAESLDAVLLTCDAKLASSPGHLAKVELV